MKNINNRVQLIGHLGADPEVLFFDNDKSLVKLRMATNTSFKNANGEYETKTQWHNLVAWNQLAERMAKALSKGTHLMVFGSIEHTSSTNDQGQTKYYTNIKVQSYFVLENQSAAAQE